NAWPEDDPARVQRFNQLLHQAAARHPSDTAVIDVNRVLCPSGRYQSTVSGKVVRWSDGVHVTAAGAAVVAPVLTNGLLRLADANSGPGAARQSP
ncbi:MAG: acyltransferase, partial [Actinobacteria bacterium]|nr:acyltransferase [Actinomycetota bacterium]